MRLYHGSNVDIDVIDLSKGKRGKDFGQGFYLSDSYTQAYRMAELTVTKAGYGNPTVSVFEWDETKKSNLKICSFEFYSKEWAEFIIMNRNNRSTLPMHNYDIVYGPIADNTVGVTINLFMRQLISIEELIQRLKFVEPKFQYFFATPTAISTLTKVAL